MSFESLVKIRYSCRAFSVKKVEKAKQEKLIELCRYAPTAHNNWPLQLFILESDDALDAVKASTRSHFNAPLVILVCYDKTKAWVRRYDGVDSGFEDAAIVGCHIMFGVEELGLGTTWVKAFDPAALREGLALPADLVPVCLFPVGYKSADAEPAPSHFVRPDASEIVTRL